MNLARLLTPFKSGTIDCKNLLELFLRHFYDDYNISKYNTDDFEEYQNLVNAITEYRYRDFLMSIGQNYARKHERCTEFNAVVTNMNATFYATKHEERYFVVCDDGKIKLQYEINKWQAYYINISNIIVHMEEEAGVNVDTHEELYKKFTDMVRQNSGKRKLASVEENEIENQIEKKIPSVDVEKYELLLSKKSGNLFSNAQNKVEVKYADNRYFVVELDSRELVFNTNYKYNYLNKHGSYSDLSKKALGYVKHVAFQGDDRCFAFAGFIHNNISYQITNLCYITMYSYIASGHYDVSMVPSDLVELANSIKCDVGALQEIENYRHSEIRCNDDHIYILYKGFHSIHAYLEFDVGLGYGKRIRRNYEYAESKMAVGKINGKHHLFLKIGPRLYRITYIQDSVAGEILINQRIANSKM